MEDKLCEAIQDIEYILLYSFNEYSSKNEDSKFLIASIDSYYKDDDRFKRPTIPKERVLEDRKKIIDILSCFYKENKDKKNDLDDFVTLFAIYCNIYIRCNFHQILSEEDFGLSELFNLIDDDKLKNYLTLIQKGIYNQDISCFNKANAEINTYSVANIYLFIFSIRYYSIYKKESNLKQKQDTIDFLCKCFDEKQIYDYSKEEKDINSLKLLEYFDNISEKLQHYLLGKDNLFESCYYKHPLPYLDILNNDIEFQDFIIQYFSNYFKNLKNFNENISSLDNIKQYRNLHSSIADFIKIENFDIKDDNIRNQYLYSDILEYRKLYLGIPSIVFNSEYYISLILEQNRLKKEQIKLNEELKEKQKEKKQIIKDFTHKYFNMEASALQEIADILLSSNDKIYRDKGQQVLFEYANKESLRKDIYMMKLMYDDDIITLYEMLRNSLLESNEPDKKDIRDVINTSLVFCLINVLYNTHTKFIDMLNKLDILIENLDDFKEDFQTEVIFKKENCVDWLRNRDINFILDKSLDWELIALYPNDYAFVYLKDIFQELFLNYFCHGNLKKPIIINLSSKDDKFIISAENYLCDNKYEENIGFKSTATGLISFANILPKLYEEKIPVEECFRVIHKKDIFRVEIELPRKRFVLE